MSRALGGKHFIIAGARQHKHRPVKFAGYVFPPPPSFYPLEEAFKGWHGFNLPKLHAVAKTLNYV